MNQHIQFLAITSKRDGRQLLIDATQDYMLIFLTIPGK